MLEQSTDSHIEEDTASLMSYSTYNPQTDKVFKRWGKTSKILSRVSRKSKINSS